MLLHFFHFLQKINFSGNEKNRASSSTLSDGEVPETKKNAKLHRKHTEVFANLQCFPAECDATGNMAGGKFCNDLGLSHVVADYRSAARVFLAPK